jgi:hypothetical protein
MPPCQASPARWGNRLNRPSATDTEVASGMSPL